MFRNLGPCGTDGRLLLSGFQALVTLTLTMYRVIWHTVVHHSSTSIYIPNFIEIGKTFCGWTDGRMDGPTDRRTFPPLMLLGRLRGVDLKTGYHYTFAQLPITSPNVDRFTGRFSITFIVKRSWVSHNTLNALIHYVEIFVFKNCCIEKLRKVHCHTRLSYSKRLLKRY